MTTQQMIEDLKSKGYKVEKDEFPKIGDAYWCIDNNNVRESSYCGDSIDTKRKNNLGAYSAKELADEAFKRMKEIAKEVMLKN